MAVKFVVSAVRADGARVEVGGVNGNGETFALKLSKDVGDEVVPFRVGESVMVTVESVGGAA